MALGATMYRFAVELSDVGRGVYESLDVRAAMHPSESPRHLVARVLAYCLSYEEGIEFGRGVSTAEEPAIWVKNLRGEVTAWIEIGSPAMDRLHRASKTGARVSVFVHRDPELFLRELEKADIHRKDELAVYVLPAGVLDALEATLDRQEKWTLTVDDGSLYLERGGAVVEGAISTKSVAHSKR